jgi:hypothetical protein
MVALPITKFIKHLQRKTETNTMSASDFSATFTTKPFRHLSSYNYLTTSSKFSFKLQRHISNGETHWSSRVVRISASSLWPNTDSAITPPSPRESNGALEVNGVVDNRYSFLKCDGSKTVHAGTSFIFSSDKLLFSNLENITKSLKLN